MTIQNINVGNIANDGTGDDLRDAFIKVNQNFQEIESAIIDLRTVEEQITDNLLENLQVNSLGSGGSEVFANFENNQLNFRRLISGENVTLSQTENTIQINASSLNRTLVFTTESGSIVIVNSGDVTFQGDQNLLVTGDQNSKTINFSLRNDISQYLDFDFGTSFGKNKVSILDFVVSTVGVDLGTFVNPNPLEIDIGELE